MITVIEAATFHACVLLFAVACRERLIAIQSHHLVRKVFSPVNVFSAAIYWPSQNRTWLVPRAFGIQTGTAGTETPSSSHYLA